MPGTAAPINFRSMKYVDLRRGFAVLGSCVVCCLGTHHSDIEKIVWPSFLYESKQRGPHDGAWMLSIAPFNREIDISKTITTWEVDRAKIHFTERQALLLGVKRLVYAQTSVGRKSPVVHWNPRLGSRSLAALSYIGRCS